MTRVMLIAGTKKGTFILESDEGRKHWAVRGPYCEHWPVMHAKYDAASGNIYAAAGNAWFGAAVWKSPDLGETWTHSSSGLANPEGEDPVTEAWVVQNLHGTLYAGVNPWGMFRSTDEGETWSEVEGLRQAPHREVWDAGAAGRILHCIVPHPSEPGRMYIAISTGGVYASDDGGCTWEPRNQGTVASFLPEGMGNTPPAGQCVHRLMVSPANWDVLLQRGHEGCWRSRDGGRSWENIDAGLPTEFGFAGAAHPREAETFFVSCLTDPMSGRYMPDGKAAIYRTRDLGSTWERLANGLPQEQAYLSVMRGAMTTDTCDSVGVYFGTQNGDVFASNNEGDSWERIPVVLPSVSSLEAVVL